MKRIGLLSVAFATVIAVACGGNGRDATDTDARPESAATPGTEGTAGERVGFGVRNWLEDRMEAGMAEVKLGELATEKARSAEVKAFGRMMVQDHTKAGDELKQIASQGNLQPPVELEDDHRDLMDRLSKLQGAEFDREYMNAMVDAHEKTLEALEDRVDKEGDDQNPRYAPKRTDDQIESRVNEWAAKTAPTVRQHLEKARQIKDSLGRRATN